MFIFLSMTRIHTFQHELLLQMFFALLLLKKHCVLLGMFWDITPSRTPCHFWSLTPQPGEAMILSVEIAFRIIRAIWKTLVDSIVVTNARLYIAIPQDEWIYENSQEPTSQSRSNFAGFGQVPPGFAASMFFFHGMWIFVSSFPHANQAGFKLHDTGLACLELKLGSSKSQWLA